MTTVLERELTPEIGSMLPRVFTPPRAHHCTGPASDPYAGGPPEECPCGCGLNPKTSWGFNANAFAKDVLKWNLLPYQKWLNIHGLEKDDEAGGFRFKTLVVMVARQQGKTTWLRQLGLWRLFINGRGVATRSSPGARLALIAAQNLQYAEGVLKDVVDEIRDNPGLSKELINHRVCLDVATPLLTANRGWVTMGAAQVGDELYHPDGGTTRIEYLNPIYHDHACYRLTTSDGRSVICDDRHLWTVQDRRRFTRGPDGGFVWKWETISTTEMLRRGMRRTGASPNANAFRLPDQLALSSKNVDLPIDPYTLGYWLGDGDSHGSRITVSEVDAPDLITTMAARGSMARKISREGNWWRIWFDVPAGSLLTQLRSLRVLDDRRYPTGARKHVPDIYLTAGTEQREELLAGLLDSDGSISTKGRVVFTNTSKELAEAVLYLARSLGFTARMHTKRHLVNGTDYGDLHRVMFTPHHQVFRLPRKAQRVTDGNLPGVYVASIEPVETRPVRCFKVDRDDGLFLAGRGLVGTHNTNGNHRAILTNRRHWRAATASRKGGRSLSVDIAMLDELREHVTTDAWDAIVPTTLVRPFSQVVCTSNAGDVRSIVLRDLRDAAMRKIRANDTADASTGLFEWSVPDDADPRDERYWHLANPALGQLNSFKLNDLRAMFENQQYRNLPGFQTEHLALDIATPILTANGWKTMGAIEVGDQVFHPDGHPIDVTHTTAAFHDRPCYRVTTTDGRTLVADADHRWMVQDRRSNRGWETLTTAQLMGCGTSRNSTGGKYAYRLPAQHALITKPVDLPIDPYLLGAWLGDGTAGKTEITCVEDEADELTALLPANVVSTRRVGNARIISFRVTERKSRDGFPARCRSLGIYEHKAIPELYLTAGTEQRLALLQGLCDTDGSISVEGRVRFVNTNRQIAESVLYLARSLGWRATIREGVSRYGGKVCGSVYTVGWTHDASEPAPFRLRRKLARVTTRPSRAAERTTISVKSITPVTGRPTRCITVASPDSLFLAGRDLVPQQNCQWVDAAEPGILPAEHWAATHDKASRRSKNAKVYAGLDVNYERSRSFIAIAARRDDGLLHTEVAQGGKGTDWIVPWLLERKGTWLDQLAVQKTGAPASGLIPDLRRAGINVVEWGPGQEVAGGTGMYYDQIVEHQIMHRPAPTLDRAAASGVSRPVSEGFVFDRRNSLVDVSPLIACVAAVWLEHQPGTGTPMVHMWPDDDTMRDWDSEGAQQFESRPPARSALDELERGTSWWTK